MNVHKRSIAAVCRLFNITIYLDAIRSSFCFTIHINTCAVCQFFSTGFGNNKRIKFGVQFLLLVFKDSSVSNNNLRIRSFQFRISSSSCSTIYTHQIIRRKIVVLNSTILDFQTATLYHNCSFFCYIHFKGQTIQIQNHVLIFIKYKLRSECEVVSI